MNDLVAEMFLPFAQITGTNILILFGGLALVVGIVVIGIVFMVYGNLWLQSYMAGRRGWERETKFSLADT